MKDISNPVNFVSSTHNTFLIKSPTMTLLVPKNILIFKLSLTLNKKNKRDSTMPVVGSVTA